MSQWQELVTDGHVRAARWRNATPFLLVAGATTITLGALALIYTPQAERSDRVANAKREYVRTLSTAVGQLDPLIATIQIEPEDPAAAVSRTEVQGQITAARERLNTAGRLPAEAVRINIEDYWAGRWEAGTINTLRKNNTVLVASYVRLDTPSADTDRPPQLTRTYGLFRKSAAGTWDYYCLDFSAALRCDQTAVRPHEVIGTLRDFLPSSVTTGSDRS